MTTRKAAHKDLPRMPITTIPSTKVVTGFWRTFRPTLDESKCIKCRICWKFCPDVSISMTDDSFPAFDYEHCKGCGICANECPRKAIIMVMEE